MTEEEAIIKASETPDERAFALAQREANALSASDLVPDRYKGNVANCMIVVNMAKRMGADPLMVAQNLDVIKGKPSFSSSFLIATVNSCGRFSPLRFEFTGEQGSDDWGCRAKATDREHGDECVGPWVTWGMANAEGWATKGGSKWKTMPELMFHYRAAAFWSRIFAPEVSMGLHTREEIYDIGHATVTGRVESLDDLTAALKQDADGDVVDAETGEVLDDATPGEDDPRGETAEERLEREEREAIAREATGQ